MECVRTSSTDPSIPPGFETHIRFHGLEEGEEEEEATSRVSIANPSLFEPITGTCKKLSSKSKLTGMFPNGTISSLKKKKPPKPKVDNKVSADKFVQLDSSRGLEFPLLKTSREEMFNNLSKTHDDLPIENIDESTN